MIWTNKFAYAVGLMTTDGNLSSDNRHMTFVSKDLDQINNLISIFNIRSKIGQKIGGYSSVKRYYYIQFGNVKLYRSLIRLGLHPNKTKTLRELSIPDKYFGHFLRGHFDGDGYSYSYWDKRWRSSFMLYVGFLSASMTHINWLYETILRLYRIKGVISSSKKQVYYLKFSKTSSLFLLEKMYFGKKIICLKRKRFKILKALSIINKQNAGMLKLVDRHA
ncbi:MAG: hypothetical protein U1C50_03385 [Patescibacteria group bacterium]|nr:hypothetical protein [Patescibacteria group bacterium]